MSFSLGFGERRRLRQRPRSRHWMWCRRWWRLVIDMLAVLLHVIGLHFDILIYLLFFGLYFAIGSDPEDGQRVGVVVGLVNVCMVGRLRCSMGLLAFSRDFEE